MTVNHDVAGSSPAGGATQKNQNKPITYSDFLTIWPVGQAVKTPPFHGGNTSSNLVRVTNGSLAQLGEHLPYKQRVTGSSPVTPTNMAW